MVEEEAASISCTEHEMEFAKLIDDAARTMSDRSRRIWTVLHEIDPNMVDMSRTRIVSHADPRFLSVQLISKDDTCCPIELVVGLADEDGSVYLSYDGGGPVLDEDVTSDGEIESVKEAIRNHFRADVTEEKTIVNDELVRVRHTFTFPVDGQKVRFPFLSILKLGWPWPWKARVVKNQSYSPWPLRS